MYRYTKTNILSYVYLMYRATGV